MADLSEVHSVNFFENMMQNAAIEMTLLHPVPVSTFVLLVFKSTQIKK